MRETPHVSVLGAPLFNIILTGRDGGIGCSLSRFADCWKLCVAVSMQEGRNAIQRDLDTTERWDAACLAVFSKTMCQALASALGQFQAQIHPGQAID